MIFFRRPRCGAAPRKRQPLQQLRSDDLYDVALDRTGRGLVVAFTGIRFGLGGIEKREFERSLAGFDMSVCYVIDRRRAWYNYATDELTELLRSVAADHERVVTLGNSMGGFGAVYFAGLLDRCFRAIAFCPRFSVVPGVIADHRSERFVSAITEWRARTAIDTIREGVDYRIFYGADDPLDRLHQLAYEEAGLATVSLGGGHNVAAWLRDRGELVPLLASLLSPQPSSSQSRTGARERSSR